MIAGPGTAPASLPNREGCANSSRLVSARTVAGGTHREGRGHCRLSAQRDWLASGCWHVCPRLSQTNFVPDFPNVNFVPVTCKAHLWDKQKRIPKAVLWTLTITTERNIWAVEVEIQRTISHSKERAMGDQEIKYLSGLSHVFICFALESHSSLAAIA